jgi:integrase
MDDFMPKLSKTTFTDLAIKKLKSSCERQDFFDAVTRGLGIRVSKTGTKTWFAMRRIQGRLTRLKIGRYPEMGLVEARNEAIRLFGNAQKGFGLKKTRARNFEEAFELWMHEDQAGKRAAGEIRRALTYDIISKLGGLPLDQIQGEHVSNILRDIQRRGANVHANRVLGYTKRLFRWCQEQRLILSSPVADIRKPTRERSRERVLTKNELQKVWQVSEKLGYPFGPFMQLLILTGQRRSEVAGMTWSEIDIETRTWTQPSSKTKNGRSHVVFLPKRAQQILQDVRHLGHGDRVFSTKEARPISGFSKAKLRLDKISGVTGWTLHDLRRTFATYATECLDASPAVIEKVLNHSSGAVTGIARVYQRAQYLSQRRDLADRWGDLVERWISEAPALDSPIGTTQFLEANSA